MRRIKHRRNCLLEIFWVHYLNNILQEVRAHAIRSRDIVFDIIRKQKESGQLDGTALGNILKSKALTET